MSLLARRETTSGASHEPGTPEARRAALAKLLPMQRDDFKGIFKAMTGLPEVRKSWMASRTSWTLAQSAAVPAGRRMMPVTRLSTFALEADAVYRASGKAFMELRLAPGEERGELRRVDLAVDGAVGVGAVLAVVQPLHGQRERAHVEVAPEIRHRLHQPQIAEHRGDLQAVPLPGEGGGVVEDRVVVDEGRADLRHVEAEPVDLDEPVAAHVLGYAGTDNKGLDGLEAARLEATDDGWGALGTTDRCTFAELVRWIDQNREVPLFATVWTFQSHYPYYAGRRRIDPRPEPGESRRTAEQKARYLSAIAEADALIGSLLPDASPRVLHALLDPSATDFGNKAASAFRHPHVWPGDLP